MGKEQAYTEVQLLANLKRCPRFISCNRNQCPLDLDLRLRVGGKECRWMQEEYAQPIRVRGKTFKAGGKVMPDGLLRYVPEWDVDRLNSASRARWHELQEEEDRGE